MKSTQTLAVTLAAIILPFLVVGCVSSAVNSVKVELPSQNPPPKAAPAKQVLLKPMAGVPYFLPKVELQLTAILTNVPNANNMVTNYSFTTTTSNYTTSITTYSSTNKSPQWSTNFYGQQTTNSVVTSAPGPSTNQIYVISITPIIVPDPDGLYALKIVKDKWKASSDNFNFQVDTNGFLQSLNATNADQTVQIVSELAQAAAEIVMAPGLPSVPPPPGPRLPTPQLVQPLPGRVDVIFDPTTSNGLNRANTYLTQKFVQGAAPDSGVEQAICPILLGATFKGVLPPDISDDYLTNYTDRIEGIVYRPLLPYILSVKNGFGQSGSNYLQYLVMSPNRSPIFSLSVERATFVTRTTSISFNSGLLNTVNYSNPSQLAAFLGLPLTVVNSIFSSITNVLQLKLNIATAQSNIATQQIALVNQTTALNNATTNLLQSIQALNQFKAMQATNGH